MHDPHQDPNELLILKSIKWRTAAGWLVVLILAWRYLVHPVAASWLATQGTILPPIDPFQIADVLAVIGLPVGGAFADRMSKE